MTPNAPNQETTMRLVIIETPYAATTINDLDTHIDYARACMRDSFVNNNEAPFASHLLYTQPGILDDDDSKERSQGIEAGLLWGMNADATIVYTDHGISSGMKQGIAAAIAQDRPVYYRTLND